MGCKSVRLDEVATLTPGYAFKSKDFGDYPDKVIKITDVQRDGRSSALTGVNLESYDCRKLERCLVRKGDYYLAMTGSIGKIGRLADGVAYLNQRVLGVRPNSQIHRTFLWHVLNSVDFRNHLLTHIDSYSVQANISASSVGSFVFELPDPLTQGRIARVLDMLDRKIELNQQTNDYLVELLVALQKRAVESKSTTGHRADEVFSIHIGKTPPRKQQEWFSFDRADNVIWMSIKDMGNTGAYLIDSSEYLTRQAVEQFNIRKCSPGSVLLSFKLTIGRVGIAANEMVTNEAIACFSSDDDRRLAYLYPLLLTYDYASMGSTSSIATAINSKMVKAMTLPIPGEEALDIFYGQAKPILGLLLSNTRENAMLEQLRDSLLPKLILGEVDVSKIELPMQPNNHLSVD